MKLIFLVMAMVLTLAIVAPVQAITHGHADAQTMAFLKDAEGYRAEPYEDAEGNAVGYGHLIKRGEHFKHVSKEKATTMLANDLASVAETIDAEVTVKLTDNQYTALASLCFNIGAGAFADSTLVEKLNRGDFKGAQKEFIKWNHKGKVVVDGLTKRRKREAALFGS